MKNFCGFLLAVCAILVAACDLQPRIISLPDSVGDFISDRYPALLADPETQPEIYNSAATDYGVYASPELYGSVETDDYILYSDINDYMLPTEQAPAATTAPASSEDEPEQVIGQYHAPGDSESDTKPAPGAEAVPDDYLVVPMYGAPTDSRQITVAKGDTLYSIARKYGVAVQDIATLNKLSAPYSLRVGQKLRVPGNGDIVVAADKAPAPKPSPAVTPVVAAPVAKSPTPARVQLQTVTVGAGDTLYSISRKYSVPVNDLAVMNDLSAPFRLTVGQRLKVPNLQAAVANVSLATKSVAPAAPTKAVSPAKVAAPAKPAHAGGGAQKKADNKNTVKSNSAQKNAPVQKAKISSDPKKKLPAIAGRSSSKFSWPVRGKILSAFGTKPSGLVNDGINIAANRGATVKAAENGVVAYAGNEVKGMGNLIIIQHSGGWMTVYAHLDSMALRRGARVSVGQKIGTVGATGKVDKPQLHFEIRKGTKAYNPAHYLKK